MPGSGLLGHRKRFILASPTLSHTTKSHYFLHLHKLPTTPQVSRYTHLWSDSPHGTYPRVRLGACGQVSGVLKPLECSLEEGVGSGYKVGEFLRPQSCPNPFSPPTMGWPSTLKARARQGWRAFLSMSLLYTSVPHHSSDSEVTSLFIFS